jgi:hypothetical protein
MAAFLERKEKKMILNPEKQNTADRTTRLQWAALILFWVIATIPFMLSWQVWFFSRLIVALFFFVGGTIIFFWKTVGKENYDDF